MDPRLARIALAMLAALVLSATGPGWAAAQDDRANVIEIKDHDRVEPSLLQVAAGTTVIWRNEDGATHRIRDDRGTFDSGSLGKDASYRRRFDADGTYTYSVGTLLSGGTWHWMSIGTLKVSGAVPAPPPAPAPTAPGVAPAPAPAATLATVDIGDDFFSPASLTVSAGTTVKWTNRGQSKHTVTSASGAFDSGILSPGAAFSFTFSIAGTYAYVCELHGGMRGTVVVTGTAQGTAPIAAPAPAPAVPTPVPGAQPPAAPPGAATVQILDNSFSPATLTVAAGTTVTWTNLGSAKHTVTSAGFDSGILASGASWSRTFTAPGTYGYVCDLHSGMSGTVVVTGTASAAAPDAAAATPAAVASEHPTTSSDTALPAAHVAMEDDLFNPRALRIATGTTVTWTNGGLAKHTVTARDGSFTSGLLGSGQAYSHAFTKAGTYAYFCSLHPAMIGTIDVTDATAVAGAAPAERANAAAAGPRTASGGDISGAIATAVALLLAAGAAVAIGSRLATLHPAR